MNNMYTKFDPSSYTPFRSEEERIRIVPTDSKTLNEKLGGGLMTGQFYIFQAPSGGGKTTLLLRMFLNVIYAGHKAAYISMGEQTEKELYERLICMVTGSKYPTYLKEENEFREKKYDTFTNFLKEKVDNIYLYYTENPYRNYVLNEDEVKEGKKPIYSNDFTGIMSSIINEDIQFIFVDYIGADCPESEKENRYQQLKLYCDQLEHLADKNNKCVVSAMQMNRPFFNYLRSKDFDPDYVGSEFTADSIGAIHKVKVGISFFKCKNQDGVEKQYFNVFKNRTFGDLGSVPVKILPYTYKWKEEGEEIHPFEV